MQTNSCTKLIVVYSLLVIFSSSPPMLHRNDNKQQVFHKFCLLTPRSSSQIRMQKWRYKFHSDPKGRDRKNSIASHLSNSASSPMGSSSKITLSLLLCLSFFALFSPSSSSRVLPSDSQKVSVDLYYESLCPYSATFIIKYLVKLFEDDLISIVDLKLVPWGNAKLRGNDTFDCQHGPYECLLNTVEACAIDAWPDLNEHFPFINCVETLVHQRKYRDWESCFKKLNLDPKPIYNCYTSGYGKELELKYAAETNALQPPHRYVPWVVVDGQPLYEDYENFLSYICKAYKGTDVPKGCSQVLFDTVQMADATAKHSVCDEESVMPNFWEQLRSTITSWVPQMNVAGAI